MSEDVNAKSDDRMSTSLTEFHCALCLSDVSINDSFYLRNCGCRFCRPCLSQFVKVLINEKKVHSLKCPGLHSTSVPLQRDEIKNLLTRDDFLTYIQLKHENNILKDPARFFCPRPNCGTMCYSKRFGPHPTRCSTCGFKFCRLCQNAWPGRGHSCPEELGFIARSNGIEAHSGTKSSTNKAESIAKPKDISSGKNDQVLVIKRCPICGIPIERSEGCHQVFCMNCGHSFCWACLANLDHEGYLQHVLRGNCTTTISTQNVGCFRRCCACLASTSLIACIGLCGLVCSPLIIVFSPCLALGAPYALNQVYTNDAEPQEGFTNNIPYKKEFEDETDSDKDEEK